MALINLDIPEPGDKEAQEKIIKSLKLVEYALNASFIMWACLFISSLIT